MFSLKDKVVYPGHGVAEIVRVVEKQVGQKKNSFLELKFLNKCMMILVPVENIDSVGVRPLISDQNIDDVFDIISQPVRGYTGARTTNWSKRNKEYLGKLRTGDLREIGMIYRDLKQMAQRKELSFGERNLLDTTESLLAEEISIVQNVTQDKIVKHVRSLVN